MNLRLLWPLVLREWRHHPWRHAVALLAVALGVALAWSVHLINRSALAEFSAAVRAANGEPDLTLRSAGSGLDDRLLDQVLADPAVEQASPVLVLPTYAAAPDGGRVAVQVMGVDALRVAALAAELLPRAAEGEDRLVMLDPGAVFPNAAARERLGLADGDTLRLQAGSTWQALRVAGTVAAAGPPLVVMDIAGAQQHFGALGRLTRVDLRLTPGTDIAALRARLALPPQVLVVAADEATQRASQVSRAYRVNLTVLALVALFVGAFLVFSVVALSVAQRAPALALLGVLGMTAAERRQLVLLECALIGLAGSVLGLLLGGALAAVALRLLGGDLGGGYFPGVQPALQWHAGGVAVFALLGTASALVGGWWPARQAQAIVPAVALKGLGQFDAGTPSPWPGLALLAAGVAAAFAPPVAGLPIAAYASVAALLFGGIALLPFVVHGLLAWLPPPRGALPLLAVSRARFARRTATAAVAGVVASLALSVALTVMVASFRDGVSQWLDSVLPADLYARSAGSSAAGEQAWLPPSLAEAAARVPGVQRVQAQRTRSLPLAPNRPAVVLVAREIGDAAATLPLVGAALPRSAVQAGEVAVWVSEGVVGLHGATLGGVLMLPLDGQQVPARVLGVWRDYARQFGSIAIETSDYQRLTGDQRLNELSLWLVPGQAAAPVMAALRQQLADPSMLEFASSAELRALSLRIFDRSFAVTYYLQAVAIAIGLVGIAASLSAQVLARRKEFGLLAHLGLTRRQVVAVVAGEGAAWVAAGTVVGLLLGVAVAVVLVHVVNPQSFHWSMDLVLPGPRLAALAAAVLAAGTLTAAFSARRATAAAAVQSVKEDW